MTSKSQLLNDLQDILPIIAANAEQAEAMRMVPHENIELLTKIKFLRAFQPKAWGGLEVSLPEFAEAVEILAAKRAKIKEIIFLCVFLLGHSINVPISDLANTIFIVSPDILIFRYPVSDWISGEWSNCVLIMN